MEFSSLELSTGFLAKAATCATEFVQGFEAERFSVDALYENLLNWFGRRTGLASTIRSGLILELFMRD